MHEFSVASSIAELVKRHAGSRRVEKITVDNGVLSGVFADSLVFYLDLIMEEKGSKGVVIEVREVPARCACECGEVYETRRFTDPCPKCGGFKRRIERGKECVVESLEVADEGGGGAIQPEGMADL